MLDAAAKDHWARNGWLWLRGFLGAAEVQDLRRWTDEIAGWPEVPGRWMRYYERRVSDAGGRLLARLPAPEPRRHGARQRDGAAHTRGAPRRAGRRDRVRRLGAASVRAEPQRGPAPLLLPDLQPRLRGRPARRLLRAQARVLPARVRAPARRRLRRARPPVQPGEPVRVTDPRPCLGSGRTARVPPGGSGPPTRDYVSGRG